MEYVLPIVLVLVSYILGVYFAFQGLRSASDKPLAYSSHKVTFVLTLVFGWLPSIVAFYLAYKNVSLIFTVFLALARFILMPTLLNNSFKSFMDKKGI